nr:putative movement protein [Andean potato mild mosaic virus]
MNHVFPDCPRSSQLNYPSRCFHKSNSQCRRGTSPRLSIPISLAAPKRVLATPSLLGHPELRSRHHPSSSPHSQNSRNFHAVQSLALSCQNPFHCHVHEAQQVFKTPAPERQLHHPYQLPLDCRGHNQVPRDFSLVPYHRVLLHARRADVLLSSADIDSLLRKSKPTDSLLLSRSTSRVSLHRSFPPSGSLHLPNFRQHPPLHPGVPPFRSLQPAPSSPILAESGFHFSFFTPALSHEAGILGPRPLSSDSERPPSKAFSQSPSKSRTSPSSLKSEQQSPAIHCPHVQQFRASRQPGFLPNSRLPRASIRHLPEPASSPPPHSHCCVQRSLHLHQSSSDSQNLRPSRVCSHPKQQNRVLLGHPECLGQSADLRSVKFSPSPLSQLSIFPEPVQATPTALLSALENLLVGSLPIPLILPSSSIDDESELPYPDPKATFSFRPPSSISLHFNCPPSQQWSFPATVHPSLPREVGTACGFSSSEKPVAKTSPSPNHRVEASIPHQLHSETQGCSPSHLNRSAEHPPSPQILSLSHSPTAPRSIPSEPSSSKVPTLLVSSGISSCSPGAISPISSSSYSSCEPLSSYASPPRFPEKQSRITPVTPAPRISASELRSRLLELHLKYPFTDEAD